MPLSYSQIQLYRTCPKKYEFACVKKIPRSISAGESFGSSVHNTLKKWGEIELKIDQKQDQLSMFASEEKPPELTPETLIDLWHTNFIVHGYVSKGDSDQARKKGEGMMRTYFDWWKEHKQEVVGIEKSFTLPQEFQQISGRFDRLERNKDGIHVIDYKTGGVRTQEEVDQDLQLSIYAIAVEYIFGEPCNEMTLLFMKEDQMIPITTARTKDDLSKAKELIGQSSQNIMDQNFEATPAISLCNRCPYHNICPASLA